MEAARHWLDDYLDELATFPAGVHDDAVDSTTQALNYLREQSDCLGLIEYLKQEYAAQMAETSTVMKRAVNAAPQHCPKCLNTAIARVAGEFRCSQCGHQFGGKVTPSWGPSRKEILARWPQ